ncbi:TPA: DUF2971 domain-containing protein [Photobacterium damselae]
MPITTFYRFRSIDNLLEEYRELEKQSIFFAPPALLNDPVEGFKDIYWQGDTVLWTNLFNHYLLCLMKWCLEFHIVGDDFDLEQHFDTRLTIDDLPESFQKEFSAVSEKFIEHDYLRNLIQGMSYNREKVGESELKIYLKAVHSFALYCIYERLDGNNLFKNINFSPLDIFNDQYFSSLEKLENEHGADKVQAFLTSSNFVFEQNNQALSLQTSLSEFRSNIFTTEFASLYVKKLEQLMFPNWFTACFMSECTNSSVWGNYGRNHTGVCMVFSAEIDSDGNSNLLLDGSILGWGSEGVIKGKLPFKFYPIEYDHKHKSINFFDSIARLPGPSVSKNWFSWNGAVSSLVKKDIEDWRKQYWSNFYKSVTKKTNDWKYENEHRLLICDMCDSHLQSDTTLQYDFKSLKGIIFGINTSNKDKKRIIKVIESKVKDNNHYDFRFYQAYYCRTSGKIKHYEISSLRLNPPKLS